MKGLLIKQPWIDKILSGEKTWELRGSRTRIRGPIALIQSGTGTVVGTCNVVDVVGPLSAADLDVNIKRHQVSREHLDAGLRYESTFAWVFEDVEALIEPVPYQHPNGAVIWVNLKEVVAQAVRKQVLA